MLDLPDVTLCVAETRCHELMRITLTDLTSAIKFGGVIIHTDKPELIGGIPGATYRQVPDWPNKIDQGKFYYMEAPVAATTSHVLMTEWDGGLRDVNAWSNDFLNFDYIGAPWVWARGQRHTVGNGGFMLLSTRMAQHVYANRHRFKIHTDVGYSQVNRLQIEKEIGAKWAPEDVAIRFSYEHYYEPHRSQSKPSFGYHDIFNWPLALLHDEVVRRTRLVMENPYIVRSTPKLQLLGQWWPKVRDDIGHIAFDNAARHQFGPRGSPTPSPRPRVPLPHHSYPPLQIPARRGGGMTPQKIALVRRDGVEA